MLALEFWIIDKNIVKKGYIMRKTERNISGKELPKLFWFSTYNTIIILILSAFIRKFGGVFFYAERDKGAAYILSFFINSDRSLFVYFHSKGLPIFS